MDRKLSQRTWTGGWLRRLATALTCACALFAALGATTAAAAPDWRLEVSAPTRVEPGQTFHYNLTAINVGDQATDGTGSLDVTLPPGVTAVSVSNQFGFGPILNFSCGDPGGTSVLHCDLTAPIDPGQKALEQVVLTATADVSANGPLTTAYSLSGGGAADSSSFQKTFEASTTPSFGIADFDGEVLDGAGEPFTQAGGHPADATASFALNRKFGEKSLTTDGGDLRDVEVTLPKGLVGNPAAATACPKSLIVPSMLEATDPAADPNSFCSVSSIVGIAKVALQVNGSTSTSVVPIFNVEPPPGVPAQFGFNIANFVTYLDAHLDQDSGQYTLSVRSRNAYQTYPVLSVSTTLWGSPYDTTHDRFRCLSYGPVVLGEFAILPDCNTNASPNPLLSPSSAHFEPKAFLTNPTACTPEGQGLVTDLKVASWAGQTDSASFESHDPPGYPLPVDRWGSPQGPTGCEDVPFTPAVSATPTTTAADSPAGLDVQIDVPTDGLLNPSGISQSNLKKAVVTLPEGMVVNPSSADGLGACSESEIGISHAGAPTLEPNRCPSNAKIGTVEIDTPLLEDPLDGDVFLAQQGNRGPGQGANPFDSMLALYIAVEDPRRGIFLKLPGRVDADPQTGRLRTTFDNNPQLPFSSLKVRLKAGPRAPLTLPSQCGTYEIQTELYPWARPDQPVTLTSPFRVDQGCGSPGFAPSWSAGSTSPIAGTYSPFIASFARSDHEQRFGDLSVELPKGVLAELAGVPLCSDTQAAVGSCPAGSRVGSATAGAGAGPTPFYLHDQPVYLTGPYKGAPYGLAVVVRALAGPFDLGTVVVRQAIQVDRSTAQVRVVSDPLPRILEGIPLNIRDVRVAIDRPQFTITPTSCAEKEVGATLTSTEGAVHRAASRFRVADCAALPFTPRLDLALTGRKQTRTGRHPGVRARVRQSGLGEAAIDRARVVLPKSLALDPGNAQALCEYEDGIQPDLESRCPKASIVGRARAVTPLLDRPLTGDVYFVKNVRRSGSGNLIRTLPMIVVALRGQIAINLRGVSSTTRSGQLVNAFAQVPDAPISRFDLNIRGGANGILAVTRTRKARIDLCANPGSHRAQVAMNGHNGKRARYAERVHTPCGKRKAASRKRQAR